MRAADTDATAAQPPWPAGAAWIDGRYRPVEQASISVLDLGVTRSDAAYDVVHVWDGRFYRLDAHLDRFAASLARLRLNPGHGRAEIEAFLHGCVRHAGLREAYVSMTCTRGRLAAGSRDLRTARNTFYCFAVPFVWISSPDQQATGASMRVSEITRIPPQSVDPAVKNYHWLDLELALLDAYDHDAGLVVLRDLSGAVTEGPGFNVFAYVDGRWLTPASGTLPGITRRSVIELAGQAGQPAEEGRLTPDDLRRATEVLVTSTAGGIMPVTVIDGQPVGTGVPGPLTRQLRDRYWASHHDPRFSTPVRYDEAGFGTPTGEAGLRHLSRLPGAQKQGERQMRIGVSGTHGTGKTTLVAELCGRLPGHTGIDEPYVLLEEDGHNFEFPPSTQDYRAQLTRSLLELRSPASSVIFDRTPLDFLAYLGALGASVEAEADASVLRSALASLDLLVVVPITPETEQVLPRAEMLRLRENVNDMLLGLLDSDPLQILGDVPVIDLTGPIGRRPEAVLAALPARARQGREGPCATS